VISLRTWGALAACAGCTAVSAQPAPRPGFERNPLYPAPIVVYGRLSAGIVKPDRFEPLADADKSGLANLERSHLGLRGTETLDGGVLAHAELEHTFNTNDGTADGTPSDRGSGNGVPDPCSGPDTGRFFGARATVGLSTRELGRVDLGLMDQPALTLLRRADPWGGHTEATPGRRAYLPPTKCATRSAGAVTYQSPTGHDLRFALQYGHPEPTEENQRRVGASLAWDQRPWLVGAGWQEWSDGSRALPLVLVHDSGGLRLSGAVTVGRAQRDDYRNYFVGLSWPTMALGDPQRNEWRIGLNRFDADGARPSDWKLGAGLRHRFSRQFALLADLARSRRDGGATRTSFDLGLSYSFARDLRYPQTTP
jgi:predicted porin